MAGKFAGKNVPSSVNGLRKSDARAQDKLLSVPDGIFADLVSVQL